MRNLSMSFSAPLDVNTKGNYQKRISNKTLIQKQDSIKKQKQASKN